MTTLAITGNILDHTKTGPVGQLYKDTDTDRQQILERARKCAALTKPWVLPPANQRSADKLEDNYQSLGSRGSTNMEGKLLSALYPAHTPWFKSTIAPATLYVSEADPEIVQDIEARLYLRDLQILATLESANLQRTGQSSRRSGFRARKRMALSQLIVTGDVLEQLLPDFRLRVFRRDQYVTVRDGSGDVLYHVTIETLDIRSLSPEEVDALDLGDIMRNARRPQDYIIPLYTLVEWQPFSRTWTITQEVNGFDYRTSDDRVSPYFSTPFELTPGEDYGRGFIEQNLGDLSSLNTMNMRLLDLLGLMCKGLTARDYNAMISDADLAKESGGIVRARVVGGVVQDVGMLTFDKIRESQMLAAVIQAKSTELGSAFIMESEVTPRGDRVTRYQAQRVANEIDSALGGLYAPIADDQQIPLLERTIYQMERDRLLEPIAEGSTQIEALTGMAALTRELDGAKLLQALQTLAALGPEALRKIDLGIAADLVVRYLGIYEPGLVKSDEQLDAEDRQIMQQQMQLAAGQQAIQSAGAIAEAQATA